MAKPMINVVIGKEKEKHTPHEKDEDGKGALWKEENPKSERHPNLTGHIRLNGKYYWLNGWMNESNPSDNEDFPFNL
jgi:hypothetical protein